jgi:hypothetical protein
VLVPGKPEDSRIISALRYENADLQMPPRGRLSDARIAAVSAWIRAGAIWPQRDQPETEAPAEFEITEADRQYWAFRPLDPVPLPRLKSDWIRSGIDAFILRKLQDAGIEPAAEADERTLIRRLYLDTTGLPPTPQRIAKYLVDRSPNRYALLVDELLASPRYGERMARHWLDVVGYVETAGHVTDLERQGTWRYRDFVIRALNEDLPYDQFVREHLAGDLIEQRRDPETGEELSILGTSFLWFYPYHFKPVDPLQQRWDQIDAQINVIGKAFLGLTQGHRLNTGVTDRGIAGLLVDLKQRGLLDETMVLWGGEFGRTPNQQGSNGRDHNPFGFTVWAAGGGFKPGIQYGETDEFGYFAVRDKVHIHDLHATMLHQLGLDHERLTYRFSGRDYRLTDVHGQVIKGIIQT